MRRLFRTEVRNAAAVVALAFAAVASADEHRPAYADLTREQLLSVVDQYIAGAAGDCEVRRSRVAEYLDEIVVYVALGSPDCHAVVGRLNDNAETAGLRFRPEVSEPAPRARIESDGQYSRLPSPSESPLFPEPDAVEPASPAPDDPPAPRDSR